MSKPLTFTVSYSTKRSYKYQSIEVGGAIEVQLEPNDRIAPEMTRWRKALATQCDEEADARLRELACALDGGME
jgi:hypothetical protein